jgi:hypothetical protein
LINVTGFDILKSVNNRNPEVQNRCEDDSGNLVIFSSTDFLEESDENVMVEVHEEINGSVCQYLIPIQDYNRINPKPPSTRELEVCGFTDDGIYLELCEREVEDDHPDDCRCSDCC